MKHNNYAEHELRERIKAEGATWVARQQFWLFGTAKYFDGTEIHERKAHKDIRHYFNTIDKALLRRQDYDEGRRLQRLVFIERGRNRVNTHFHFFIKGTHLRQYRTIWRTVEANWTRHIQGADSIQIQDNIEFIYERKGYCWKEFDDIRSETLHVPCCHLQQPKYT
jgi:hypothetical protein